MNNLTECIHLYVEGNRQNDLLRRDPQYQFADRWLKCYRREQAEQTERKAKGWILLGALILCSPFLLYVAIQVRKLVQ